ncbi:hypothetical protein KBC04_03855 [Candidatus Babeliales bacterium]|nr:hypothetical protein [Candidatus Babeliales bacterium]MBP9844203.1 hypothetical protein [Candidatus Babeliales bacterium]
MKKSSYIALSIMVSLYSSLSFGLDIKAMIEGMGESFGVPPHGYVYSYEVWNDAHIPMYVEQEGIASFMGGYFRSAKAFFGRKKLPSIFEADGYPSKVAYHKQDYYFHFYISDRSPAHEHPIYTQFLTQLPLEKNDPNVYYYHTYTRRNFSKGDFAYDPEVEIVGYQNPSETDSAKKGSVSIGSQLSVLNFFNSSGVNVKVSLTYGTQPYSFTVEKYSHNSLGLPTPQEKKSTSGKDSAGTMKLAVAGSQSFNAQDDKKASSETGNVVIQAGVGAVTLTAKTVPADASKKLADENNVTSTDATEKSEAPPMFSLRPNTITFAAYNPISQKYDDFQTLKLPSDGFEGKPYTIEIFQQADKKMQVALQGLMPGNYDIASTPRSRDLTPCPSTFWYQAVEQTEYSPADGYIDLLGQVWVVYLGGDNPVCSKVVPGQAVSWNLTRPLLSQSDEFVYFVYVVTTDDAIAENFVRKVAQQSLGKDVMNEYKKAVNAPFVMQKDDKDGLDVKGVAGNIDPVLTAEEKVATLMGNLSVSKGVIEDKELQVIGYLLGTDIFMPKGLGFGRFYYVLAPALVSFNNLITLLNSYLDNAKTASLGADVSVALKKVVEDWFAGYMKNKDAVKKRVELFLLKYGNAKLIDVTTQQLTSYGKGCLNAIISGKISLKYPPLKLSTVMNQYVYDFGKSGIDKMPSTIVSLEQITGKPQAMTYTQNMKRRLKNTLGYQLAAQVDTSAANDAVDGYANLYSYRDANTLDN